MQMTKRFTKEEVDAMPAIRTMQWSDLILEEKAVNPVSGEVLGTWFVTRSRATLAGGAAIEGPVMTYFEVVGDRLQFLVDIYVPE